MIDFKYFNATKEAYDRYHEDGWHSVIYQSFVVFFKIKFYMDWLKARLYQASMIDFEC